MQNVTQSMQQLKNIIIKSFFLFLNIHDLSKVKVFILRVEDVEKLATGYAAILLGVF